MTKHTKSTYKRRRAVNGADQYANFTNGVQNSSESVAGATVTHAFSKGAKA